MVTVQIGRGQKKFRSIKDAAAHAGINYNTYYQRRLNGWSEREALSTPVRPKRKARRAKRTVN